MGIGFNRAFVFVACALVAASSAVAQIQLHAPGSTQGYVARVSAGGTVEAVSPRPYLGLTPHLQLAMGSDLIVDVRIPGTTFTYSSTLAGTRIVASAEAEYLSGVRQELQKPGGALASLPCQSCLALSASRLGASRYLLALYNQAANAISLVELEGASDGRLLVRSARVETGITTSGLFQLGASRNGSLVVSGGAARTLWLAYSDDSGLLSPTAPLETVDVLANVFQTNEG